jgi:hypothetical protein
MKTKKNSRILAAGLFKQDRKEARNLKCPKNFEEIIQTPFPRRTREPNRILNCPFLQWPKFRNFGSLEIILSKYSFIKTQQWRSTKYSFAANIVLANIDHLSLNVFVLPYLKRIFKFYNLRSVILHSCQGKNWTSILEMRQCAWLCAAM